MALPYTIPTPDFMNMSKEALTGAGNHATVSVPSVDSVASTLTERGKRYGKFKDHATISQHLEDAMRSYPGWFKLSDSQKESLEMIAHKVARILNGDPNYADSWHDIAGYAKLVDDELNGKEI